MADASVRPIRDSAGRITGYQVRWREGAKRPGRSFGPDEKPLAERFAAEQRAAQGGKTRKSRRRPNPAGATLAEYVAKAYEPKKSMSRKTKRQLSSSTKETREHAWDNWIKPHLGDRPIRSISVADVEALLKRITFHGRDENGRFPLDDNGEPILPTGQWKDGLSTAKKVRTMLNDIFFYAVRDGVVKSNPTIDAYIEVPDDGVNESRVLLTDVDIEELVRCAPGHFQLPIRLMATIGIRIGELAALRVGDFDHKNGQLHIRATLSTKPKRLQGGDGAQRRPTKTTAGNRRVLLPSWLANEIALRCVDRPDSSPLFTSTNGCMLRPDNFRSRVWVPLRASLALDESLTPHDLRHYAATRLLSDDVDEQEVCNMLGHAHVGITNALYRHARPEHRRAVAEYWERIGPPSL
jgi:integrase